MSDLIHEPTDDEFARLMDERMPSRLTDQEPPEENVQPVEPEAEAAPVEDGLPEKYQGKSPAELARMHAELEAKLGQQGQELGELRRLAQEVEEIKAARTAQPEVAPPAPWEAVNALTGLEESVLTNPKGTIDWIVQNQPQLYERALETWAELDPFAASRYDNQYQIGQLKQQHEAELAAVRQPVMQSQNDAQLQQAYVNVANSNPLLRDVAEDIPVLLEENPELKVILANGDVQMKERTLNNLVLIAAARRGTQAQEPSSSAASDAAHAKKIAATVASGSAEPERASGQTEVAKWKQQFVAAESTSIQDELARNRAAAIKSGTRRA